MNTHAFYKLFLGLCALTASSVALGGCNAGKVGGEPVPLVTPPPEGLKVPVMIRPSATFQPVMPDDLVGKVKPEPAKMP